MENKNWSTSKFCSLRFFFFQIDKLFGGKITEYYNHTLILA